MKQFMSNFKAFILRGNIIDMAVGVIIGGAFNKIVSSLVEDLIMPMISALFKSGDIATWRWLVGTGSDGSDVFVNYGRFLQTSIDFLIIALSIFIVLRVILKLKREKAAEAEPEPTKGADIVLLEEIRDALRAKSE